MEGTGGLRECRGTGAGVGCSPEAAARGTHTHTAGDEAAMRSLQLHDSMVIVLFALGIREHNSNLTMFPVPDSRIRSP